jgi:hypothetical protein
LLQTFRNDFTTANRAFPRSWPKIVGRFYGVANSVETQQRGKLGIEKWKVATLL